MTAAGGGTQARVLVTRPEEDSGPLVAALAGRGHAVLRQPLLRIVYEEGAPPDLNGVQALLFTSANGVRAFARRSDRRDLPAYAVGDATAGAARDAGFARVKSAGGDVSDLAALIRRRCDPTAGVLFHAAGSAVAGDLAGMLGGAGYAVRRVTLYRAEQASALEDDVRRALAARDLDFALFFSPRSAAGFASLATEAGVADACGDVVAVCLSDAVARAFGALAWRRVVVAAEPTQDALLAALDLATREETETDRKGLMTTEGGDSVTVETGEGGALFAGVAEAVIERFGGIRPMAAKLGVPVTTVQGWKNRGHIPDNRHEEVQRAAAAHGIDLRGIPAQAETPPPGAEKPVRPETPILTARVAGPGSPATRDAEPPAAQGPTGDDATEPVDEAVAPVAAPVGRGAGAAGWAALALAVLAIAAAATQPFWSPIVYRDTGVREDLTARLSAVEASSSKAVALGDRLAATDERLAGLIRRVEAAPGVDPGEIAALTGKLEESAGRTRAALDRVSQRLGAVEEQVRTPPAEVMAALSELRAGLAALEKSIAAVEARVVALERRPLISGERIAAVAIAAGQLDAAVASGEPYGPALDRLRALARDDKALQEALAPLELEAGHGVATLAALTARFAQLAPHLSVEPEKAETWFGRLREKARAMVNMRPVGAEGERSPVTRAERALAQRDLAGAVQALSTVGGGAVAWRRDADARLAAERALGAMRTHVAGMLARETAGPKAAAGGAK